MLTRTRGEAALCLSTPEPVRAAALRAGIRACSLLPPTEKLLVHAPSPSTVSHPALQPSLPFTGPLAQYTPPTAPVHTRTHACVHTHTALPSSSPSPSSPFLILADTGEGTHGPLASICYAQRVPTAWLGNEALTRLQGPRRDRRRSPRSPQGTWVEASVCGEHSRPSAQLPRLSGPTASCLRGVASCQGTYLCV